MRVRVRRLDLPRYGGLLSIWGQVM
jgi:hypothetical protein